MCLFLCLQQADELGGAGVARVELGAQPVEHGQRVAVLAVLAHLRARLLLREHVEPVELGSPQRLGVCRHQLLLLIQVSHHRRLRLALRRAEALAPVFLDRRHDQPPLGALACELAAQLGAGRITGGQPKLPRLEQLPLRLDEPLLQNTRVRGVGASWQHAGGEHGACGRRPRRRRGRLRRTHREHSPSYKRARRAERTREARLKQQRDGHALPVAL